MDFTATGTATEPLCPLCNSASGTIRYDYGKLKIIRCRGCGLWRTCPRLAPEELTAYYSKHYYSEELRTAGRYEEWRDRHADVWRVNARLVLEEARKSPVGQDHAGGAVALLDVGCGHGFFLEQCAALGIQARGIEVSSEAARYARDELKLDVRELPLDGLPAGERYDVITLWGVLEHVPHPLRTMEQVRAHLRPGGQAWVMTPNSNALLRFLKGTQYFNFLNQSHLTHFQRKTLKALLERAGLENVRRYIHWGGGGRRGLGAAAQYAARWLCWGTELRFIAEAP
ncbi:MAG: class I SAM-dependent methyltransferase [Planctomycetota bacterium]